MTCPRPCLVTRPRHHGRQPRTAPLQLGESACECVGDQGDKVGVSASLAVRQGSPHFNPSSLQAPCRSRGLPAFGLRGRLPTSEAGHGGCPLPLHTRVLRENLCCPQDHRRLAPRSGPVDSQPLPGSQEVPHGVSCIHQGLIASRRLGGFHRPPRCLFPHPHSSSRPQVAPFCLEGHSLPVPSSSFWPRSSSVALHQVSAGAESSCAGNGHQDSYVPGRLADPRFFPGRLPLSHQSRPVSVSVPRLRPQRPEVGLGALSDLHLPGHGLRHGFMDSATSPTPPGPPSVSPSGLVPSSVRLGPSARRPSRPDGVPFLPSSLGSASQAEFSAPLQGPLLSGSSVVGLEDSAGALVPDFNVQVDGPGLAVIRSSHRSPSSPGRALHRRFRRRLGRPHRSSLSIRHLVSIHAPASHKCVGVGSRRPRPSRVWPFSCWKKYSAQYRQYHCCVLRQQAGGGSVSLPLSPHGRPSTLVSVPGHLSSCKTCSGSFQRPSGLPQSVSRHSVDRMDFGSCSASASLDGLDNSSGGPVCDEIQSSAPDLCLSGPGPLRVRDRRIFHFLVRPPVVRVSSLPGPGQGSQEGQGGSGYSGAGSALLASPAVVPGPSAPVARSPDPTQRRPALSTPAAIRHPAREPRRPQPSRLASVRDSLSALGASSDTLDLVSRSHRPSTRSAYASHWKSWLSWCGANSVQPFQPREIELANFLSFLSSVRGVSSSSVSAHRSAICTTLRQTGGPVFSDSSLLRDVVRGASLSQVSRDRRVPAWDLFLVLASLREPPYEPLASSSLRDLTFKTAFLVTLASGRRCSEVHSLSGLQKDIAKEPHGALSLRFLPEFVAKNQDPLSPSPSIMVRPLTTILCSDDPDRSLCPVRALRYYRRRTEHFRGSRRRLFLSWNESYTRDISKSSLSRWLSQVIGSAYARSSPSQPAPSTRAHEIRAWSASLAFACTRRLNEVLDAAYWRSPSTFIDFYLRDVSRTNGEGVHGISSVVVAQHPITSSRSSSRL